MSSRVTSESTLFESEVQRINNWGSKSFHPALLVLGISSVAFAACSKRFPVLEPWVPWVLCSALSILFLVYGLAQGLLAKAIGELFSHIELSELPDNSPDLQAWYNQRAMAVRGMQNGFIAGVTVLIGIALEAIAKLNGVPPLWCGALPAAFVLFLLSARFFHQEHRAAPENLATAIRQIRDLRKKPGK